MVEEDRLRKKVHTFGWKGSVTPRDHGPKLTRKRVAIIAIAIVTIIICALYAHWYFNRIGKFGEDYWFEGDKLKTKDGWTFTVHKLAPCSITGKVLGRKVYHVNDWPKRPINTFSPLDIFIGTDDVMNNTRDYDYSITSYNDRYITWWLDGSQEQYEYFRDHVGNIHIVPHNANVASAIMKMGRGDVVTLDGYFVDLDGKRGDETYTWTSGTSIGDSECEIILLDGLTINGKYYCA